MAMKKILKVIIPLLCVVLLVASCKPKVKQANGRVTYFKQDTMKVMINGDEEMFLTDIAKFPAGAVMEKDSVEVIFVKDRAQIVRLIPQQGHIINTNIDKTKPLLVSPDKKDDPERSKKFIEMMNKKNKQNNHK